MLFPLKISTQLQFCCTREPASTAQVRQQQVCKVKVFLDQSFWPDGMSPLIPLKIMSNVMDFQQNSREDLLLHVVSSNTSAAKYPFPIHGE